MIFSFLHPKYLFFLVVIPLFVIIHFFALNNKKKVALKFANFDAIARIRGIDFFSKNLVHLTLSIIIVLLLIFSVSGLTLHTIREASDFSFIVAIDSSQSMGADDFEPDRITVAKQTARKFVESVPSGTKVGIVSFSGSSYIEQILSKIKSEIFKGIDNIELSGYGGTDLYEAVLTSTNLLMNEEAKAIILLSDGQLNVGVMDDIIDYANRNNVMVHSIAMGTVEGGVANYALSKLDEDALRSLSYNTDGKYFNALNDEMLLKAFLDILNLTEKKVAINLTDSLLFFAIVLFIFKFFVVNTRYFSFF